MSDLTLLQLRVLWEISRKPRCGYDLMNLDKNKKITQGTMYPLLKNLEKIGLVNKEKGICGKEPCRCKKYYEITKKGKKVLKESCKKLCGIYEDIFKEYVCKRCKK
jgi:DNA-binding PadR family transcriptional regulator